MEFEGQWNENVLLVSANDRLVDFQSTLELAGRWGSGEVASADGMRFVTPPVRSYDSMLFSS